MEIAITLKPDLGNLHMLNCGETEKFPGKGNIWVVRTA
jgi:hypothetical protein